jgi:hypothetical protein
VVCILASPAFAAERARISSDGHTAIPPASAPKAVKRAIYAANRIVYKPYLRGGGHRGWEASGYDCSGSVSYALHAGGFLGDARNSRTFRRWGKPGVGRWITIWTKPGHTYAVIAGLRFDTSALYPERGERAPRWRHSQRSSKGFKARHPAGF